MEQPNLSKKSKVIDLPDFQAVEEEKSLQRTDEWFEQRQGKFTGSGISNLMVCDRSSAKYEWGRPEKIIGLGDGARKYIFEKCMERRRNKIVKTPVTSAMKYGTMNETTVIALLKEKHNLVVEEVGFLEFIDGLAGASPDGRIDKDCGYEGKCSTDWGNFYLRVSNPVDQKHMDFWQLQSEMLALKSDQILYCVAEPSESIFEPNITDLFIQYVNASKIHQAAIIQRCYLGKMIMDKFLSGMSFTDAITFACTNFEIDGNKTIK